MDEESKLETTVSNSEGYGGYIRLAEHMDQHPQLTILRRFGTLANATLLYYQAEITELEKYLEFIQKQDGQSDDENRRLYSRSWLKLSEAAECSEVDSPERRQYESIMKLRKLMAQYHKALYFHREAMSLPIPHTTMVGDLRGWIFGRVSLLGFDRETWESDEADLITFVNSTMDRLTSFVTYTLVDIYHDLIGRHIHTGDGHPVIYTHRSISLLTEAFTVLVACSLPVAAIVILYSVDGMVARLGVFAALTALFSISMSLLAIASRPEIFIATSAFAAVLVFFLGSTHTGQIVHA